MATFITIADVEYEFGKQNVKLWSDIDNDDNTTFIASRQTRAMNAAEEYILARLRRKGYSVDEWVAPLPELLKQIIAMQAGYNLYRGRGVVAAKPSENALIPSKKEIERMLASIRHGTLKLTLDRDHESPFVEKFANVDDRYDSQRQRCLGYYDD